MIHLTFNFAFNSVSGVGLHHETEFMMKIVSTSCLRVISLLTLCLVGCQSAPAILLSDGRKVSQGDLKGQWKVINVWAEWCKPCWQEIPEVNRFYQQLAAIDARGALEAQHSVKAVANAQVFGFNFDELDVETLQGLKQTMNIQFPVLAQWPDAWAKVELKGLPATVFISPTDEVAGIVFGPQDLDSLNQALNRFQKNK